jgi:hypothetical protein
MLVTVYTLWASMKGEEPSPWMIAAEDEFSWEGNPERCEAVFDEARQLADRNGWDVREVNLEVDLDLVHERFEPGKADGIVTEAT